jgi:cellulose biosynthesis protein BcsQ
MSLSQALKEIPIRSHKEKILYKALQEVVDKYDYVILDCPASVEDSVINAIYFADRFLIPVEIGAFASSAIQDVLELIAEIKESVSLKELLSSKVVSFLRNKVDGRGSVLNQQIEEEIRDILPYTMNASIRQSLYISRAGIAKMPILQYSATPAVVKNDYIEYVEDRKGHDFRYAIDSSLLQKTYKWSPAINMEEGLKKTIEWYLHHPKYLTGKIK